MEVTLIGMGLGDPTTLTAQAVRALEGADGLIGARRLVEGLNLGREVPRYPATKGTEILEILRRSGLERPCVLYSGDTGFYSGARSLTALLENMLELSQLVSSESPLPVAQTDIRLLCAERLELQKQLGDNPAVEYVNEAGTEIEIPTNAFYLTRVVDNLLHNAAKFTAAGRITLRCRNDEPRRTLQISVSDTGIGIPPEKQEWVFERFTKVDPFKPGSGIGLYLCRLIVTRLGGDIRVCPEYSGGCCIRIELPY